MKSSKSCNKILVTTIICIYIHYTFATVTAQTIILQKINLKELTMYERNDGLMRGSREERIQEVLDLREYEWNFDTLLGIIPRKLQ